jgi:parallel beta-helix repeat protein
MRALRKLACVTALAVALPAVADQPITVDCSNGETIGEVLSGKAHKDKPLVLMIRGTCHENVTVGRDDVALEGDVPGAAIFGSVTIDAARRVSVSRLSVTNPAGDGISVENGASATVRDSTIAENGGHGIAVLNASFAIVERNILSGNGRTRAGSGLFLAYGSTARGLDNILEDNTASGIDVGDSSNYRSDGDRATMRPGSTAAVDIYRAGFVDLRRTKVNGIVFVNQQSQLQVRNVDGFAASELNGTINVGSLAFMRLRTGVVRTGTLNCFALCQIDP